MFHLGTGPYVQGNLAAELGGNRSEWHLGDGCPKHLQRRPQVDPGALQGGLPSAPHALGFHDAVGARLFASHACQQKLREMYPLCMLINSFRACLLILLY